MKGIINETLFLYKKAGAARARIDLADMTQTPEQNGCQTVSQKIP
jgi:hypothetical protein